MIRCDKAMRKSKERCLTPFYKRWKCTGECKECICGIEKEENGLEHHITRGRKNEQKEEGCQG